MWLSLSINSMAKLSIIAIEGIGPERNISFQDDCDRRFTFTHQLHLITSSKRHSNNLYEDKRG